MMQVLLLSLQVIIQVRKQGTDWLTPAQGHMTRKWQTWDLNPGMFWMQWRIEECSASVLDCLGWYPRMPQTGRLIDNRNVSLTVCRLEVQDQGTGRFSVWWGPTSRFMDGCLLAVAPPGRRSEDALWCLFKKGTNPRTWGFYSHDLITSQRPHVLTSSHWL